MSQIENLLNSVSEEISTVDHVVIGKDRFMVIPDHIKKIGVSPDHGVNTVKFVGPRYSENGTDLSTMSIWVNYMRADGYMDAGRCENIKVDTEDDTLLHYEWKITRNITEVHGNLTALVCAKSVDAEGNEENHWNSELNHDFYISEGMEVQETVITQYPDIVEYLLLRMTAVENKTTQKVIMSSIKQYIDQDSSVIIEKIEEVIADYPVNQFVEEYLDSYIDICTTENRVLEGSYAGAYEMVNMKGASEQKYLTGKNLFDVTAALANQKRGTTDVTNVYTAYGNGVQTSQNSYDNGRSYMYLQLDPGSYNISANVSVESGWNFSVKNYDADTELINQTAIEDGSISYQFVLDTPALIGFCFMSVEGSGPATYVTNIQLEIGDAASEYEEYCGGMAAPNFEYEQEIKSVGPEVTIKTVNKNFLKIVGKTSTNNGITFTVNEDDGTVTVNGTATAGAWLNLTGSFTLPAGDYILSGCPTGGAYSATYVLSSGPAADYGNTKAFTLEKETEMVVNIGVYKGYTAKNLVFKPMISRAGGEFVKHKSSEARITVSDGLRSVPGKSDVICKKDGKWGIERWVAEKTFDGTGTTFFKNDGVEGNDNYLYVCALNHIKGEGFSPQLICRNMADINKGYGPENVGFSLDYNNTHMFVNIGYYLSENTDEAVNAYIAEHPITIQYANLKPTWEELDDASQIALDSLRVFDGITHVIVNGDIQPVVTSRYGTSQWGARAIDNTNRIEKLEELLGVGNIANLIWDVSQGGTGGTTASEARQNLEVYSKAEVDKLLGDVNAVLESLIGGE